MRRLHRHLDFATSVLAAADSQRPFELANQAGMAEGALRQGAEARRKKNCANEVGVPLVLLVLFHLRMHKDIHDLLLATRCLLLATRCQLLATRCQLLATSYA